MREIRSSGPVEGVTSNRDPYSDSNFRCHWTLRASVGKAAVRAQHLGVDPSAVRPCAERYFVRNVSRLPHPLQWRHFREFSDLIFSFTVKEQFGCDRSRCDRVYAHLAAPQFVREHVYQALHTGFGRDVWSVRRKGFRQDTAGESNDPASSRDMPGGLREHQEGTAKIRCDDFVERLDIAFADRR